MKIITLANQKGGCGKSTVSINLALSLAQQRYRVILLDADPQRNIFETIKIRESRPIRVIATQKNIYQYLERFEHEYDHAIIDTPPYNEEIVSTAILCSDMTIVPVQNSPLDLRSTRATAELIRRAREVNPQLKAYFLLYRVQPLTLATKELAAKLRQQFDIGILKSYVSNRVVYSQSLQYGKGIAEFSQSDIAVNEMRALVSEIMQKLLEDEPERVSGQTAFR